MKKIFLILFCYASFVYSSQENFACTPPSSPTSQGVQFPTEEDEQLFNNREAEEFFSNHDQLTTDVWSQQLKEARRREKNARPQLAHQIAPTVPVVLMQIFDNGFQPYHDSQNYDRRRG